MAKKVKIEDLLRPDNFNFDMVQVLSPEGKVVSSKRSFGIASNTQSSGEVLRAAKSPRS